jgi:hypothetical protein
MASATATAASRFDNAPLFISRNDRQAANRGGENSVDARMRQAQLDPARRVN